MRTMIYIFLLAFGMLILAAYCESKKDPNELGMHLDYSIICEYGYKYKVLDHHRGTVPVLDRNGKPVKCY